jgi:hypothetical protein
MRESNDFPVRATNLDHEYLLKLSIAGDTEFRGH